MNKIDFDKLMKIEGEKAREKKENTLLLHSCCAPCSTACIERLLEYFDLSIYYYNPNIDTLEEFNKRSLEQKRYLDKLNVKCFLEDYLKEDFSSIILGLEGEKEGGKRCEKCFYLRLKKTAIKAKELGLKYFATTLTVSPLKNAELINRIGTAVEEETGVKYLQTDFKKQNGYKRSIELSKENNMYRQNYCGCEFSKRNY